MSHARTYIFTYSRQVPNNGTSSIFSLYPIQLCSLQKSLFCFTRVIKEFTNWKKTHYVCYQNCKSTSLSTLLKHFREPCNGIDFLGSCQVSNHYFETVERSLLRFSHKISVEQLLKSLKHFKLKSSDIILKSSIRISVPVLCWCPVLRWF